MFRTEHKFHILGTLFSIITVISWSFAIIIDRILLNVIDYIILSIVRTLILFIPLLPISTAQLIKIVDKIPKHAIMYAISSGIIGFEVGVITYLHALSTIDVVSTVLILSTIFIKNYY